MLLRFSLYDTLIRCLAVDQSRFTLFRILWASWSWMSVFFFTFSKFSAITSSKFYALSSAPFPFGTPIIWTLLCLILSDRSLNLSPLFKILFSFCCSVWVSSTALSSKSLILSSASTSLLLDPSNIFFSSVRVFLSSMTCLVLYFLSLCWHSVFIHSSPKFSEHLYEHYFELFIR